MTNMADPRVTETPRDRKNRLERERRAIKKLNKIDDARKADLSGQAEERQEAIFKRAARTEAAQQSSDVRKNSICVIIKASRLGVRRTVGQDDVNVEATPEVGKKSQGDEVDQDMVTVGKELIDSPQLRAIMTFDHMTKLFVKARSVPSPLLRSSAYLIAVDGLADLYAYLEDRRASRRELEDSFVKAYPALVADAKKRLGPLFDQAQYPAAETLRRKFRFEWQVVEIGTPSEKLRGISKALFEKERDKAEKIWSNAVGQINEALAEGMQGVVKHLTERLGGGDEPPKRFQQSAVKRVTDFLDAFKNRNVTNNEQLAELADRARKLVDGVDVKELRGKDEVAADKRREIAAGFADIQKSLDGMLEDKPARAMSLAADEEV